MRVSDDVLEMPLDSVYPALEIESVFNGVSVVRIVDRCVYIILDVIVPDCLVEDFVAMFCE